MVRDHGAAACCRTRGRQAIPQLDLGPVINAAKAKELTDQVAEAVDRGAVPLHRGSPADVRFLPGQDTSAYVQPVTLLNPPPSSPLHHAEPFGPVDTIVLVDTKAELLAAMNASNGGLVTTLSTDDRATLRAAGPADPGVQGRPRRSPLTRGPRGTHRRLRLVLAAPSSAASCW